jgi:hypothetical protein
MVSSEYASHDGMPSSLEVGEFPGRSEADIEPPDGGVSILRRQEFRVTRANPTQNSAAKQQ